jgi:hypothetical protein
MRQCGEQSLKEMCSGSKVPEVTRCQARAPNIETMNKLGIKSRKEEDIKFTLALLA